MIGDTRDIVNINTAKLYDVADFAIEISADSFYGKTFTIHHK
jgi:hypothetical protein